MADILSTIHVEFDPPEDTTLWWDGSFEAPPFRISDPSSLGHHPLPDLGDPSKLESEVIVDRSSGEIRSQAGADGEGDWVRDVRSLRRDAETSLYFFAKVILGRGYLSAGLHLPICNWLQGVPPRRKLLMLPREHCKSTIVSQALPIHILIQPRDGNLYFPDEDGTNQRIVLACETEERAKDHMYTIIKAFEDNALIRGLWPHRVWKNPRRESKRWSVTTIDLPRSIPFNDPTIRAIGVDGAVTGQHPSVLIKDDLIAKKAAEQPTVMRRAIEWHRLSRMLIGQPRCLEFVIGTHWAVGDLYDEVRNDPTVECLVKSIIEDGEFIYPELVDVEWVRAKKREVGSRNFTLQYMNTAIHPELSDFDERDFRYYQLSSDAEAIEFEGKDSDIALSERFDEIPYLDVKRGDKLKDVYSRIRDPKVSLVIDAERSGRRLFAS